MCAQARSFFRSLACSLVRLLARAFMLRVGWAGSIGVQIATSSHWRPTALWFTFYYIQLLSNLIIRNHFAHLSFYQSSKLIFKLLHDHRRRRLANILYSCLKFHHGMLVLTKFFWWKINHLFCCYQMNVNINRNEFIEIPSTLIIHMLES